MQTFGRGKRAQKMMIFWLEMGLWGLVGLLVWLTLLGFWAGRSVWGEIAVSFRPNYLWPAFMLLVWAVWRKKRVAQLLLMATLAINLFAIRHYIARPNFAPPAHAHTSYKTLLYNADRNSLPWVGLGGIETVLTQEKPHLVVIMEIGARQANELQARWQAEYPHTFYQSDTVQDGTLILSHWPMRGRSQKIGGGRLVPQLEWSTPEGVVTLLTPHPTNALMSFAERNDQLTALAHYVAQLRGPHLVVGDLNVTPWSPWYQQLEKTGLHNARQGRGVWATWQSPLQGVAIPIDHILLSAELQPTALYIPHWLQSDHAPLIATWFWGKNELSRKHSETIVDTTVIQLYSHNVTPPP